MLNEAAARREAERVYRELGRQGLMAGGSGNVSVRIASGMVISPTGATPETISAERMVSIAQDGAPLSPGAPSSEWPMHAAIYRDHADAGCIVHTHADACTALSCLNERLPPFHYMLVLFGGDDVPCAPYVTFGTPELAAAAAAALRDRTACLLGNHGMIVRGKTPDAALSLSITLEILARQYLLARSAGAVRLLTEAEMVLARARYATYGAAAAQQD